MKTYIYKILKAQKSYPDDYSNNHISVYRVKNNKPIFLANERLAFRGGFQAVFDIIAETENWGKRIIHSPNGFNRNGVRQAWRDGKVQIIQV